MKQLLITVFSVALIVLLLMPMLMKPGVDPVTEGTQMVSADPSNQSQETVEPAETEEYAGSGIYNDFEDNYTIVKETLPEGASLAGNDRGWILAMDNRRITVWVDSEDWFHELIDIVEIKTAAGLPLVRNNNKMYVLESDTVARESGTIWQGGDEAVKFFMRNEDYVFTIHTELIDLRVEYSNGGYYEWVLDYDVEGVSAVRLEVSDYDGKEVRCFVIGPEGETEIFPEELSEEELYDYKNPNK